jgi:dihydrofolate synthase/folylpolyglutamate synthase
VTYEEAIAYLLTFADFERSGRFHERPDLAPVLALLAALGDPHAGRPTAHITGSKGKGSVAAMIESCLRAAGYRTGLFTSPHLHSYCERIRIDGEPVSEDEFASLTEVVSRAVDEATPGLAGRSLLTFDLLTAMGFLAFRDDDVDVQVIEVGLGGRLDSTNVFETKDVAVFTPISLEHTDVLGDTPGQIARDKAGIITPGCAVVLGPQPYREAADAIREAEADAVGHLVDVSRNYASSVPEHGLHGQTVRIEHAGATIEPRIPLIGAHQAENAATAVAALHALQAQTGLTIDDRAIVVGLAGVAWPGRMEVLQEHPLVIADGAHNRESARRLVEALHDYAGAERATFIVGALADKNVSALAEEIAPVAQRVIAARSRHPRAMEPERIADAFNALPIPVETAATVAQAVDNAIAVTPQGGVICLIGSLFVAAEGREHLLGVPSD